MHSTQRTAGRGGEASLLTEYKRDHPPNYRPPSKPSVCRNNMIKTSKVNCVFLRTARGVSLAWCHSINRSILRTVHSLFIIWKGPKVLGIPDVPPPIYFYMQLPNIPLTSPDAGPWSRGSLPIELCSAVTCESIIHILYDGTRDVCSLKISVAYGGWLVGVHHAEKVASLRAYRTWFIKSISQW